MAQGSFNQSLLSDYKTDLDGAGELTFSVVIDRRAARDSAWTLVEQVLALFEDYEQEQDAQEDPPAAGSDPAAAAVELVAGLVRDATPAAIPEPEPVAIAEPEPEPAIVVDAPVVAAPATVDAPAASPEPEPEPGELTPAVPRFSDNGQHGRLRQRPELDLAALRAARGRGTYPSNARIRAGEKAAEHWRKTGRWPTGSQLMEIAKVAQHAAYHGLRDVKAIARAAGVYNGS